MLFQKKRKPELETKETSVAVVEKNDIEVIEVRDVKQHLVNQFNYVHELESEIKELKEKIDLAEEVKFKYDAALVTLDEFDNRLKSKENHIKELNAKISLLKEEKKKVIDDKNTCIIKLNQLGRTKEEIEEKLQSECEEYTKEKVNFTLTIIKNVLMNKKGTLTKSYVKEIIEKELME